MAKPRPTLEWFYDADTETIRIYGDGTSVGAPSVDIDMRDKVARDLARQGSL